MLKCTVNQYRMKIPVPFQMPPTIANPSPSHTLCVGPGVRTPKEKPSLFSLRKFLGQIHHSAKVGEFLPL